MITVENLTKTSGTRRAVHNLSLDVHPGRLSGLVIVSVSSIIAEGWFGLWLLTRGRRTLTA